jgi:hypothetical protein
MICLGIHNWVYNVAICNDYLVQLAKKLNKYYKVICFYVSRFYKYGNIFYINYDFMIRYEVIV